MVNELRTLLRENVADSPTDQLDVAGLLAAGHRRVRTRRTAMAAGAATLGVVAAVAVGAAVLPGDGGRAVSPAGMPRPDAPVLRLADAEPAVEGQDYRELSAYTNENLDRDNGQYYDGVTDDGLVLFRDGPRMDQLRPRYALLDPATGAKDWLPDLRIGQAQAWPVELGTDRLVLVGATGRRGSTLVAHVFDRGDRTWSDITWPELRDVDFAGAAKVGPDGRLYIGVPATRGTPPPGGWPTGPDGEAEDADAEGDTFDLYSLSLTDPTDVRDEGLRFGQLDFTPSSMVWTDSENGAAGMVHVRDLASGEERSFDPHAGERCNLLSFGATDERIMMSEYCGTYGGVRDDRVQVLTTDGEQVVTLQDSGVEGALLGHGGPRDVVTVTAYESSRAGTYVYDLASDRLLRLSDATSSWSAGGPTPDGQFLWSSPVNHRKGATQHLTRLLD